MPGGCLDDGEALRQQPPAKPARSRRHHRPRRPRIRHLCHHADPDGQARVGVFFAAQRWADKPINAEPDGCSEIGWHHLDRLPADIVSYIRTGLLATRTPFSLDGW